MGGGSFLADDEGFSAISSRAVFPEGFSLSVELCKFNAEGCFTSSAFTADDIEGPKLDPVRDEPPDGCDECSRVAQ